MISRIMLLAASLSVMCFLSRILLSDGAVKQKKTGEFYNHQLHFAPGEFEIVKHGFGRTMFFYILDCKSGMQYRLNLSRIPRRTETFELITTELPGKEPVAGQISYVHRTETAVDSFLKIQVWICVFLAACLNGVFGYEAGTFLLGCCLYGFSLLSYIFGVNRMHAKERMGLMLMCLMINLFLLWVMCCIFFR